MYMLVGYLCQLTCAQIFQKRRIVSVSMRGIFQAVSSKIFLLLSGAAGRPCEGTSRALLVKE